MTLGNVFMIWRSLTMTYNTVKIDMTDAKPDVHLGYRGGSGGFILLHLLLCSGEYHVSFDGGHTFNDVMDTQWRITDPRCWKNNEVWPNHADTVMECSPLPRIFYYCNPGLEEYFSPQNYIVNSYQRCKDPSWPDVKDFESYSKLPKHIRDECEIQHGLAPLVQHTTRHKKFVWIYTDIDSQNELSFYKKAYWYYERPERRKRILLKRGIYNNTQVDISALPFLQRCDTALYLQDVVKNPSILVDQGLIRSVNTRQTQLIERWLSLHPLELLQKTNLIN